METMAPMAPVPKVPSIPPPPPPQKAPSKKASVTKDVKEIKIKEDKTKEEQNPMDTMMQALIKHVCVKADNVAMRKQCVKRLTRMASQIGPKWRVRPFGSSSSGFGTRFSDLDVSCHHHGSSDVDNKSVLEVQQILMPLLHQDTDFEILEEINNARVPIVKMRYKQSPDQYLDVDLSFLNAEPFRNTQLMQAYAKLQRKVYKLVILVKLWAKGECVVGADSGHLSSYALILMVLYYLQVDDHIQMPCLPVDSFDGSASSPDFPEISWSCPMPLSTLLYGFFNFYASKYAWGQEIVSVRMGKRLNVDHPCYAQLNWRYVSNQLHIEDPFLLHRNLNCVLRQAQEDMLYAKICEACAMCSRGKVPHGLYVMQLRYCLPSSPEDLKQAKVESLNVDSYGLPTKEPKKSESKKEDACGGDAIVIESIGVSDLQSKMTSDAPSHADVPMPRLLQNPNLVLRL
jgi:DNA polymerase sigma